MENGVRPYVTKCTKKARMGYECPRQVVIFSHILVLVPHFFTTRLRNSGHRPGEFGVYQLILHSLSEDQTRLQASQASQVTGTDLIPPTLDETQERFFIGMIFENDATMAISGPFRAVSTQLDRGPAPRPHKKHPFLCAVRTNSISDCKEEKETEPIPVVR